MPSGVRAFGRRGAGAPPMGAHEPKDWSVAVIGPTWWRDVGGWSGAEGPGSLLKPSAEGGGHLRHETVELGPGVWREEEGGDEQHAHPRVAEAAELVLDLAHAA